MSLPALLRFLPALLLVTASIGGALSAEPEANHVEATIDARHAGPVIHRNVFGQFAEFVGNVINDGLWVGEDSTIPNTRGWRNDIVEALRAIRVPLVRWPGGCYADVYHWRDGIGPREQRPRRINVLWGGGIETNAVGTHEFFDFLELIGADAYINGNIGSGTPREMADWVEYMTGDRDSTLVRERQRNGRQQPFHVAMFGIGNETWACGGNMRPEYSADLHKRYRTFLYTPPYATIFDPKPTGDPMLIVASGGNGDDYDFTRAMMANAVHFMDALTLHYYTTPRGIMGNFGPATGFAENEWASTLKTALRIEELVSKHSAVMDEFDPDKRVGLYVDEWGAWYDPTPGRKPAFLFQQNTLRDAVVAALYLNTFQRHADRVRMSSVAQVVNVLQAPILTDKEKMVLTPTYYVYRMYVPFHDAALLPAQLSKAEYRHGDIVLPAVDLVAARATDGRVHLSIVNLDPRRPARVSAAIAGVRVKSVAGEVLTAASIDSHNDFDGVINVQPAAITGKVADGKLLLELPPRSVTVVAIN